MTLVNETKQVVEYWIVCDGGGPDCGTIAVDGIVDLPTYDSKTNVVVSFKPQRANGFSMKIANTGTDEQVQMSVVAE